MADVSTRDEAARLYNCACGSAVPCHLAERVGWRRCLTDGAILWACPQCLRVDASLRPLPPREIRTGRLNTEVGGHPAGTEVRLVERSGEFGWSVRVPRFEGDPFGLPLWVLDSQVTR